MKIQKLFGFRETGMAWRLSTLLVMAALWLLPSSGLAQLGQTWNVASGNWDVAANWSPESVPTGQDVPSVDNGGTAIIPVGAFGMGDSIIVGNYYTGSSLEVYGGISANSWMVIGFHAGSSGTVTVHEGGSWGNPRLDIGFEGTGTLNIDGGAASDSEVYLSNGTVNVTNGGTWTASFLEINSGALNIDGGTVRTIRGTVYDFGTVTVASGTLEVSYQFQVENGTLNLTGGVMAGENNGGTLELASSAGSAATLNVGGGTLKAAAVHGGDGNATVNFNPIGCVAFAPQLTGALAVNKQGTGTTILSAVNTYTGETTVEAGRLKLGVNGAISDSSGVRLAPGGILDTTALACGRFEMLDSQPFVFTLDPTGNGSTGLIDATGLDITNALVDFVKHGTLDDEAYIIANYTSLIGGKFGAVRNLPGGYSIDYHYNGNQIALVGTVPEPGSWVLMGLGAAALACRRYGKRMPKVGKKS